MKYEFKGIVRGSFSNYQACGLTEGPLHIFKGDDLDEILSGLAIDEFIFILKSNGRRIKNPWLYIKRQGLDIKNYTRKGELEDEKAHAA